jgi:adenylate cyclase
LLLVALGSKKLPLVLMERDTAILIADLSGYTALTEAHGASMAADLVDKYVAVIKSSLVGDCVLHQSIGDEVVIVSPSPEQLLATTHVLLHKLKNENHFLQVHGALHYGKLLLRNNSFFGSAINLTSRMANIAPRGSVFCSKEFIDSLKEKNDVIFKPAGLHQFKNVSGEKELFELVFTSDEIVFIDPVCRMIIKDLNTAVPHPQVERMYFCSDNCLNAYIAKPVAGVPGN